MKDKVLFWIKRDMIHFGIAKSLQEKHDCDLFAVIETTDRPKKLFQEQQFVKFRKVWYLHDHISILNREPDLKYLAAVEERYKINLWSIAYSERKFLKFNRYHKFTNNEILSLLEQECRFFESVLDEIKPDFLIINVPDFHHLQLLYEICRARGIKTLMLNLSGFGGRWMITSSANKLDETIGQVEVTSTNRTFEELQNYLRSFNYFPEVKEYVSKTIKTKRRFYKWIWLKSILLYLLPGGENNDRNRFFDYGKTRSKAIMNVILLLLKRIYRQFFLDRNSLREINEDEKFVYYPLQSEPESTLLIGASFYANQLETITNIAKSLPVDYKLYVKDHPIMRILDWRSVSYYKKILELPNVRLIHYSVNPSEIIKKCSLVIAAAGSSCLEAAFYEKPAIIFSDAMYSGLSSVYRLKSLEDLPDAIRSSLQRKVDLANLNRYVNLIDKNSFEFNFMVFGDETDPFYGAFVPTIDVPISKMQLFLEKHNLVFEKLAMEFIKKIKQYKEYEQKNIPNDYIK